MRFVFCRSLWFLVFTSGLLGPSLNCFGVDRGELEIRVVDKETGEPVAVRMHLKDPRGKVVKPPKVPFWHDHFVFNGKLVLDLPLGHYTFEIERGLEYREQIGHFTLERGASDNKTIEMTRFVDMKKEGWWSGDLHTQRATTEIETLMLAEDLHIAPLVTWSNEKNDWQDRSPPPTPGTEFGVKRFYNVLAGRDSRAGGSLLFFNLSAPLPLTGAQPDYPSAVDFLKLAKRTDGAFVAVEKSFAWDLPVWIASRRIDSIGVAHGLLQRDSSSTTEAGGKPRDAVRFPNPSGNGRWSLAIYYHLLNCGLRIPPSASSAAGISHNPLGYNRTYVHCGDDLTWNNWWDGLRAGRVVITNGPMLRPLVNGELPGHIFRAPTGEAVELSIGLNLAMREKVDYLEIIKDGETFHEVRLDEWAKKNGELPPVKFDRSGWLILRAVTNNPKTYRFAMSAPYYVEIGEQPRISRASAKFFLDWVHERVKQIKLPDATQREAVIKYHRAARDYWQQLVDQANAD